MKLVKKWLLPVLTCLIVLGAAVLPPYLSQMRDRRQFGQVHTETLDAGALPVRETLTFQDRIALYTGQYNSDHPILSFRDTSHFEDSEGRELANVTQKLLTGAGIVPDWVFREEPFDNVTAVRVLLWDPEGSQEPSVFWDIEWTYYSSKAHQKSVETILDAETGLPISLYVGDTNLSQWQPYQEDALRATAERFVDLLGLEVREVEPGDPMYDPSLNLRYALEGSKVCFLVSRAPTSLTIQPALDWQGTDASAATDG